MACSMIAFWACSRFSASWNTCVRVKQAESVFTTVDGELRPPSLCSGQDTLGTYGCEIVDLLFTRSSSFVSLQLRRVFSARPSADKNRHACRVCADAHRGRLGSSKSDTDLAVRRLHDGVDGLDAALRGQAVQEDRLRPGLLHHRVVDLEVAEHLPGQQSRRTSVVHSLRQQWLLNSGAQRLATCGTSRPDSIRQSTPGLSAFGLDAWLQWAKHLRSC